MAASPASAGQRRGGSTSGAVEMVLSAMGAACTVPPLLKLLMPRAQRSRAAYSDSPDTYRRAALRRRQRSMIWARPAGYAERLPTTVETQRSGQVTQAQEV